MFSVCVESSVLIVCFFRKQITALSHVHRKDIQQINRALEQFQCNSVPTDPGQTALLETVS